MMNFSIAIAVYNEEKNIKNLLDSISKIDYPKENFEISLINDGSTDKTDEVIKEWISSNLDIKIVYKKLEKNYGRIIAREQAVRGTSFVRILLTDSRCVLPPDILNVSSHFSHQVVIGNAVSTESGSVGRLFYLLRMKIYPNSFGDGFEDIWINLENFEEIGKGSTIFLIDKDLFLESLPKEKGRYSSDDTKILHKICEKTEILKTSKLKCSYFQREGILEEMKHLFERGPRFVDYYYISNSKYFLYINALLILLFIIIVSIIIDLFIYVFYFLIFLNVVCAFWLKKSLHDFFISFFILPFISIAFFSGIIYGLFLKIIRRY